MERYSHRYEKANQASDTSGIALFDDAIYCDSQPLPFFLRSAHRAGIYSGCSLSSLLSSDCILIILSGSVTSDIGEAFAKGSCIFIPYAQLHGYKASDGGASVLCACIGGTSAYRVLEEAGIRSSFYSKLSKEYLAMIQDIFSKMFACDLSKDATAFFLLARLSDLIFILASLKPKKDSSEFPNEYIRAAVDYISKHYSENVSVKELSAQLHINRQHLHRLFIRHLGVSPMGFLISKRISEACRLLSENHDISLKDIASLVGYGNYPQFSRIFTKHTGIHPSVYRKNHYGSQI